MKGKVVKCKKAERKGGRYLNRGTQRFDNKLEKLNSGGILGDNVVASNTTTGMWGGGCMGHHDTKNPKAILNDSKEVRHLTVKIGLEKKAGGLTIEIYMKENQ